MSALPLLELSSSPWLSSKGRLPSSLLFVFVPLIWCPTRSQPTTTVIVHVTSCHMSCVLLWTECVSTHGSAYMPCQHVPTNAMELFICVCRAFQSTCGHVCLFNVFASCTMGQGREIRERTTPPPCCCRATRGITQHQLPLVGMHAHMKPRAHEGEGPCLWSCAASRQSNAPDGPARKFCPHMKRKSRIKA